MVYEQFDKPTQVVFWDNKENCWCAGIAYGGIIICGCCGGIFEIEEIYECAPEYIYKPVRPYDDWVDFADTIMGIETPNDWGERGERHYAWNKFSVRD